MNSRRIIIFFLTWRVALLGIAFLAVLLIPQFGGSFPYYEVLLVRTGFPPAVWGFGNFDGVHYLTIAQTGYSANYTQAFFPLYPLLIKIFNFINNYFVTGLILSNLFFLSALIVIFKLFRMDYSSEISKKSMILLLAFPTAYYFGALYTESIFLFLVASSLFFVRKRNFLIGGLLAGLASGTRVVGVLLFPLILVELYLEMKKNKWTLTSKEFVRGLLGSLLAPVGLLSYMIYLKINFNDPLLFLNSQSIFGRTNTPFIFLPQVFFRYIKIFITVPPTTLPFFNALLEFSFTVFALVVLVLALKKIRLSYIIFTLGVIIVPTMTGTLLSMPRFALMSFLLFPFVVERLGKFFKTVMVLLIILEALLLSLFVRGYWVS